jgi:hypothetical protein
VAVHKLITVTAKVGLAGAVGAIKIASPEDADGAQAASKLEAKKRA